MTKSCANFKDKRGFTLTEIAIVLGIIGLILGAIWTAAARVYDNQKVAKTVTQVLAISNAVRATYAGKASTGWTAGTDLTVAGVKLGWYPQDMLQNITTYGCDTAPCPVGAWLAPVLVYGDSVGAGTATSNNFSINFQDTSNHGMGTSCSAVLAALVGSASSSGLTSLASDSGGGILVTSATSITDPAITTCGGNVFIGFTL